MKRPRHVLTGVTASLFVAGLLSPGPVPGQPPATRPAEDTGQAKAAPAVLAAADTMYAWLDGTVFEHAKTREDVVKQFPAMPPTLIEQALARLIYDGRIRQRGDGSAANPYRYYDRTSSGG
jgi:hypothetical protein